VPEPTANANDDPLNGPGPRADARGLKGDLLVLAGFAAAAALAVWLGFGQGSGDGPAAGTGGVAGTSLASRFVGDAACAECHPGPSAAHARSGHSMTLRPAAESKAAGLLDGRSFKDGEYEADWRFARRDGTLHLDRNSGGEVARFVVDYAFGSGKHATTFVSVVDQDTASASSIEHRLTYFAGRGGAGITPGQSQDTTVDPHELSPTGRNVNPEKTRDCFGCHTTLLCETGANRLDPATLIPNVSCERCHGPAREHVEAARKGRKGPPMPFGLGQSSADLQMRHCGFCHRHPEQAPPGEIHPDNPGIARFQPVGLMQSACYKKTPGGLSCTACHDPHARASTDAAVYEAACLSCHTAPAQAACPVSPAKGCVPCHMPPRDSGQDILFHDHWIRSPGPVRP